MMSDLLGLGFDIEHIVVVMFESRYFDNLLGARYPYHQQMGPYQFEGILPEHTSIIRTVLDCFVGQEASINARDENAPSFAGVMSEKGVNTGISEKPAFPAIPIQQIISDTDNHLTEMWKLANPM